MRPRADGGPADTVFATVPAFRLTDQAGQPITNQTFAGRAYVADFFFATCPGICPKMQGELLKVYKQVSARTRAWHSCRTPSTRPTTPCRCCATTPSAWA